MRKDLNGVFQMDWSEHFYYDETIPSGLRWARDVFRGRQYKFKAKSVGDCAGWKSLYGGNPYYRVRCGGYAYLSHRVIWSIFNGDIPNGYIIDHLDGNTINNKISNLRCTTMAKNSRNAKLPKTNVSGFCGVCLRSISGIFYYIAQGGKSSKSFSISRYGLLPAFAMACKWREDKIKELNEQGAGYTERHGTNE